MNDGMECMMMMVGETHVLSSDIQLILLDHVYPSRMRYILPQPV